MDLSTPLNVAGIEIRNRVFLAPMSGVSDVPFRNLAWEYGAGLVVSEMVASQALVEGEAGMALKADCGELPVRVVQIAGCEAKWMALAAQMAVQSGAHIVDINMGCPAKRVINAYSGSALMRDLDHAISLVEAVVDAVDVPVTLKMRLGWDDASINAQELAKRAEATGVQIITVHGRTRCQFYKGQANWDMVKRVREAVRVPLVVNGDIVCAATADEAIRKSGADAVMIGRGAYGNPWIAGQIAGEISSKEAFALQNTPDTVTRHYDSILDHYGEVLGLRLSRKHLGWYLDNLTLDDDQVKLRKELLTSFNSEFVKDRIMEIYQSCSAKQTYPAVAA